MSECSICGSELDYDDYCRGDNAHQFIRGLKYQLTASNAQLSRLREIEQVAQMREGRIHELEDQLATANERINKLERNIDLLCKASWEPKPQADLEQRIKELEEGLKRLEWIPLYALGDRRYCACPACYEREEDGHKPTCWLAKLIGGGNEVS